MPNPELNIVHDEPVAPDLHGQEKLDAQTKARVWVQIISEIAKARFFLAQLGQPDSESFVPAERFLEIAKRIDALIQSNPIFGDENSKKNLIALANKAVSYPALTGKANEPERQLLINQKYTEICLFVDELEKYLGAVPEVTTGGIQKEEADALNNFKSFYNNQKDLAEKINPDAIDQG